MDALVGRQFDLISCLGMLTSIGTSSAGSAVSSQMIADVKKQIATDGLAALSSPGSIDSNRVELKELLGQGSYGKVYKVSEKSCTITKRLLNHSSCVFGLMYTSHVLLV